MTGRGSSQHRGGIPPSVVPESPPAISGIFETSNRGCFDIPAFSNRARKKPRSRGKPGMTVRGSSQHRGGIPPSVVPESPPAISGIFEISNRGCFDIPVFSNRSRKKPRSRGKPGMTGRGSSQQRGGIPPSVVPETRSAYPGSQEQQKSSRKTLLTGVLFPKLIYTID